MSIPITRHGPTHPKECETCEGEGVVYRPCLHATSQDEAAKCPLCHGTGRRPVGCPDCVEYEPMPQED